MNAGQQLVEIRAGARGRIELFGVMSNAFQTTGNVQQGAVKGFIPVPGQPHFGKRRIERRTMPVTLGVGKGTVDIKNDRAQSHDE